MEIFFLYLSAVKLKIDVEAPQAPKHIPTKEEVLRNIAAHFMQTLPPKNSHDHDHLLTYFDKIGAILRGTDTG